MQGPCGRAPFAPPPFAACIGPPTDMGAAVGPCPQHGYVPPTPVHLPCGPTGPVLLQAPPCSTSQSRPCGTGPTSTCGGAGGGGGGANVCGGACGVARPRGGCSGGGGGGGVGAGGGCSEEGIGPALSTPAFGSTAPPAHAHAPCSAPPVPAAADCPLKAPAVNDSSGGVRRRQVPLLCYQQWLRPLPGQDGNCGAVESGCAIRRVDSLLSECSADSRDSQPRRGRAPLPCSRVTLKYRHEARTCHTLGTTMSRVAIHEEPEAPPTTAKRRSRGRGQGRERRASSRDSSWEDRDSRASAISSPERARGTRKRYNQSRVAPRPSRVKVRRGSPSDRTECSSSPRTPSASCRSVRRRSPLYSRSFYGAKRRSSYVRSAKSTSSPSGSRSSVALQPAASKASERCRKTFGLKMAAAAAASATRAKAS